MDDLFWHSLASRLSIISFRSNSKRIHSCITLIGECLRDLAYMDYLFAPAFSTTRTQREMQKQKLYSKLRLMWILTWHKWKYRTCTMVGFCNKHLELWTTWCCHCNPVTDRNTVESHTDASKTHQIQSFGEPSHHKLDTMRCYKKICKMFLNKLISVTISEVTTSLKYSIHTLNLPWTFCKHFFSDICGNFLFVLFFGDSWHRPNEELTY